MTPDEIRDSHLRLFKLTLRHGNDEEKAELKVQVEMMRELRAAFPGGHWLPIEEMRIPSFLVYRCEQIARARHERAQRFDLTDKFGARRSLDDEIRTVKAQYVGCVALGIPFDTVKSAQTARTEGNIGSNVSCFIPKPGHFNLLVGEKEPPRRTMLLVQESGTNYFAVRGWIFAKDAKRDEYQREFVRGGVVSRPYLVPPDDLNPIKEWVS